MVKTTTRQPVALVLTDCHCGKETVDEFLQNWREAVGLCKSLQVRQLLFAGDLVSSRSSQPLDVLLAIHDVFDWCRKEGIRLTLMNGNHCKVDQESPRGYCNVFDSFANVEVVGEWGVVPLTERLDACMVSYFPENGSFPERLKSLEKHRMENGKPCDLLVVHEGIRGGLSQPSDSELPPSLFKNWKQVLAGHYHNRCEIAPNIRYIGSSRQMNFGEDEEKGYTLVYPDGTTEFVKNRANIRYAVIDVDAGKTGVHLRDYLQELKGEGRYRIKVRVHATQGGASCADKDKLLEAGANKVEIVTDETQTARTGDAGLLEKFDSPKIIENYRRFCQEKGIDAEQGLSYLQKT